MLSPSDFHAYQVRAIKQCTTEPRAMLWLDLGLGKTGVTLTALLERINSLQVYRALVVAPKRVAELVWRQELKKWEHLSGLHGLLLRGSVEQRTRDLHRPDCHLHIVNYEMLPWLVRTVNDQFLARGRYPPWNMLILDEVDRFKNSEGKRYRFLHPLLPYFSYRIGMTGTPASNSYLDLHGQYLAVDDGKRLYQHVTDFRSQWFKSGYAERSWELLPGAKADIEDRIEDITLSMLGEDYLKLPDYQYLDQWVDMSPEHQKQYDALEQEMFAQLERHEEDPLDGEWQLQVHTRLSARAKCRQFANGTILHPDTGLPVLVHDAKLEMLDRILHEANGQPVFLAYLFRSDMERILERYRKQGYRVAYIGPGTKDVEKIQDAWNAQQYHLLVSHPASAGVGLNLQQGGNKIVWFGMTDNLRFYKQFNGRLRRQGQMAPNVVVHRILARSTIDAPLAELLTHKEVSEHELKKALSDYRKTKP